MVLLLRLMKPFKVTLSTATGCIFSGVATSLDLRTENGCMHVNSSEESFLNMIHATELTLQTVDGPVVFALDNAVASLKGRHFTVLARSLRIIEAGTPDESNSIPLLEISSNPPLP